MITVDLRAEAARMFKVIKLLLFNIKKKRRIAGFTINLTTSPSMSPAENTQVRRELITLLMLSRFLSMLPLAYWFFRNWGLRGDIQAASAAKVGSHLLRPTLNTHSAG